MGSTKHEAQTFLIFPSSSSKEGSAKECGKEGVVLKMEEKRIRKLEEVSVQIFLKPPLGACPDLSGGRGA